MEIRDASTGSAAAADSELTNLRGGIANLHLQNTLTEECRRFRRIADVTLAVACFTHRHPVDSQHRRIDIHEARGIVRARMRADVRSAHTLGDNPLVAAPWIKRRNVMDTNGRRCPLAIQCPRDDALPLLIAAAVAHENDVDEPMLLEAPRSELQYLDEHLLRSRDGARISH